jgi:hypothetical protein
MNPTFNLQDEIDKAAAGTTAPMSYPASVPAGAYQYADGGQATMRPPVTTAPTTPVGSIMGLSLIHI